MKKIIITLIFFLATNSCVFSSTTEEARAFFNNYMQAANTYSPRLERMYSPKAVIIRQVIKPSGELVNVYTDSKTYLKQLKVSSNLAKVRNYKNNYSNITVSKAPKGYKISAIRQPSGDSDRLKMYQIIEEQPNGNWLIIEEMMQTRQQVFLKYR